MPRLPPMLPARKPRLAAGRTVILDTLTAGAHPDAVVGGVLVAVAGLLAAVGLAGLTGPVISLDLFRPDLGFGDLLRFLVQIAVSVAALLAAGLGLARHPRFPAVFIGVAASLTVLISFILSQRLLAGGGITDLPLFILPGIPVILAVPYVMLSRRCRLIFRRRLTLNDLRPGDLKALTGHEDWPQTSPAPAWGPLLPAAGGSRPAPAPRRGRHPRPASAHETGAATAGRSGQTGPAAGPPGADAPNAALWAALYGAPAEAGPGEEPADAAGGSQSGTGKRVGLEALINLRPPGP